MGTLGTRLLARAVIALALTVCFYGLGVALICLLLAAPVYLAISHAQPLYMWLAFLFYPGVAAVVRAMIPHRAAGASTGIPLRRTEHPELFGVIEEVAREVGSPAPEDVYLTFEAGASVSQRPGRPWQRTQPELYLGLAFLEAQTVSQLRSVLAHELAHFDAGDTRVGAWLHHVQMRLNRTLEDLDDHILALHIPFVWYARLFTRITAAVSRRQELAADAVAAELYGGTTAVAALRASHRAHVAFHSFVDSELVPVLDAGFRPPIIEGFRRFVTVGAVRAALDESWDAARVEARHETGDSHPAIAERLALAARYDSADPSPDERSALGLLSEPEGLEIAVLCLTASEERVGSLGEIAWEDVADRVWAPRWRPLVERNAEWLHGRTIASLPQACTSEAAAGLTPDADPRETATGAGKLAAAAACLALLGRGWNLTTSPGEPVSARWGDRELSPFEAVADDVAPEQWAERCAAAGVAEVPLAPVAAPEVPSLAPPVSGTSLPAVALPLAVDRKSRVPTFLGLVIAGAIAIPIGLFTAAAPILMGAAGVGIAFGLVLGLGVLALYLWFCAVHARGVLTPAVVELGGGTATFRYAALFKSPLVVPMTMIRSVSFDPGNADGGKNRRFPLRAESWGVAGDPDAEMAWLWTKDDGSLVPLLSVLEVRPNAAFLFDPMQAAPPIRREVTHGPLKHEALSGLLVRFADPEAAEAALVSSGVVRDLVLADAQWIEERFYGPPPDPVTEQAAA